jgi:hypothetical protein
MSRPFVGLRLPADEHARVEAFLRAWRGLHGGSRTAALRALLRFGLDTAARPQMHDERWLDLEEQLARMDALIDALGVAVSAIPALVAWLQQQAAPDLDDDERAALGEHLELLIQGDWDDRCRRRGIPRPRPARRPRRPALGSPQPTPTTRPWQTTVRLPLDMRERVVGLALREQTSARAALQRALRVGLDVLEGMACEPPLERLLEATRRIQVQLDEIGSLATGGPSVAVHLWRRLTDAPDELEAAILAEMNTVAMATWAQILAGPPQAAIPDAEED